MTRILTAALALAATLSAAAASQDDDSDSGNTGNNGDTGGQTSTENGGDLSDVRAHTDDAASDAAGDLGARANTTGRDVQLGPRSDNAGTRALMAHELAHTVQQRSQASDSDTTGDDVPETDRNAERDERTGRERQSGRARRDERPQ